MLGFEADFFGVCTLVGDLVTVFDTDFFGVLGRGTCFAGDFSAAFSTTLARLIFLSCDLLSRDFDCLILLDFLSSTCLGLVCLTELFFSYGLAVSSAALIGLARTGFVALTFGVRFSDLPLGSFSTITTSSFHALKIAFITDFTGEALISDLGGDFFGDSCFTFVIVMFLSSCTGFLTRLPVVSIFVGLKGEAALFTDAIALTLAGVYAGVFNAASVIILG